jgi:hypothetical protein
MTDGTWTPDWCCAPSGTLEEWLEERKLTAADLFVRAADPGAERGTQEALGLIVGVLERKPLTEAHAVCLHRSTGISVAFWLGVEGDYRAGLAAGRTDMT